MAESIYNVRCQNCPHSQFHHLDQSVQELIALGLRRYDPAIDNSGPCRECDCEQFKLRQPSVSKLSGPGISLKPATSRNDFSARRALNDIDDMLDDSEDTWEFARSTLEGIRSTIESSGTCTGNQRIAIDNIYEGGLRGRELRERDD